MHFSKTYAQLLLTLPPELQRNAIEYRQLKKLINKVVFELESLGLSPAVLQELLQQSQQSELNPPSDKYKGKQRAFGERPEELEVELLSPSVDKEDEHTNGHRSRSPKTKVVYEVVKDGGHLQPRLRVWVGTKKNSLTVDSPTSPSSSSRVAIFLDNSETSSPVSEVEELVSDNSSMTETTSEELTESDENTLLLSKPIVAQPGKSLIWTLQKRQKDAYSCEGSESGSISEIESFKEEVKGGIPERLVPHPVEVVKKHMRVSSDGTRELIIPLASDMAFFQLLYTALQSLTSHLHVVRQDFISNIERLASTISRTARPQSAICRDFHPSSSSSDPSSISSPLLPLVSPFSSSFIPGGKSKSDLYAWREIFQLYVEAEVFESLSERDRGERDIVETERRLALFAEQVTGRGLSDTRKLKLKESRDALETFLQLNVLILNLKKFQFANAEAARKILKKHAKRTALHIPNTHTQPKALVFGDEQLKITQDELLSLIPSSSSSSTPLASLPHLLVQAIGERLLPVIPHIDDYQCLICMSIAFKPVRLACGHLFCVRCLVKMQKRGQDQCPCCRSPTVLKADRSNVDWAMLNFMQDWFPRESALKLRQNEKEAAQEHLEEMGIQDQSCIIC